MFEFLKYNKTNYRAGGLLPAKRMMSANNIMFAAPKFVAPKRIDNRDLCIATSDQGQTSQCAAYSTVGQIEVKNWKRLHYPEQINPAPVYAESKRLDGDNAEGTSLDNAAQAAINLGLIKGDLKFINKDVDSIKFAVHSNDICVGGFLITDEWNYVNKNTGEISSSSNASVIGGHAVLICGYDQNGLYIQNSWSPNWGLYGFALLSWEKAMSQFMYGVMIIPSV